MIRAAEYKDNAQQCRELARQMLRPEDRDALERIAQIWERLAIVPDSILSLSWSRNHATERLKVKRRRTMFAAIRLVLTEQIVAFVLSNCHGIKLGQVKHRSLGERLRRAI